jgi:hypothetical protein
MRAGSEALRSVVTARASNRPIGRQLLVGAGSAWRPRASCQIGHCVAHVSNNRLMCWLLDRQIPRGAYGGAATATDRRRGRNVELGHESLAQQQNPQFARQLEASPVAGASTVSAAQAQRGLTLVQQSAERHNSRKLPIRAPARPLARQCLDPARRKSPVASTTRSISDGSDWAEESRPDRSSWCADHVRTRASTAAATIPVVPDGLLR